MSRPISMSNVWYVFQACGAASWLVMFTAILAMPLSMLAIALAIGRVRSAKVAAGVALIVALIPLGIGAAGTAFGRAKVDKVLESGAIEASFRERIRVEGYKEADGCMRVGVGFGALPLVFAVVGVALTFALGPRRVG